MGRGGCAFHYFIFTFKSKSLFYLHTHSEGVLNLYTFNVYRRFLFFKSQIGFYLFGGLIGSLFFKN